MSVSTNDLRRFYKQREKNPNLFTYDDEGDLIERNKEGAVIKTLPLPHYRKPTADELELLSENRKSAIATAEQAYEQARIALREAINFPDTPKSEIIKLNRKVSELDVILQSVRFPLRMTEFEDSVQYNKILFDDTYEERTIPYKLSVLKTRPFTLQDQYVRISKEPVKRIQTTAELEEQQEKTIMLVLFQSKDDPKYGYLTLEWPIEFEFNSVQYSSAYQGLMAEMAKTFNDEDNLQKIMTAESANDIEYSLTDVSGDQDINETKWNSRLAELLFDINYNKFSQNPELAQKLIQTKLAKIGYYKEGDNLLGIGISLDNPDVKKPSKWSGQNLLGKTLQQIRNRLKSEKLVNRQMERQAKKLAEQGPPTDLAAAAPVVAPVVAPVAAPKKKGPPIGKLPTSGGSDYETEYDSEMEIEL
jgi:ribA/ribD-fused uncharacterized protein